MTQSTTRIYEDGYAPRSWLQDEAGHLVTKFREHGFSQENAYNRQMLAMGEEVGELLGAYRRWNGQARRGGSLEGVFLELADVTITAHCTAAEFGMDLDYWCLRKLRAMYLRGWREERA